MLDEARRLAASGVRELNLIAEDTNQYGMDLKAGRAEHTRPRPPTRPPTRPPAATQRRDASLSAHPPLLLPPPALRRYGLAELLRALSEIQGIEWIRILYAYPSYFTDALIDEIAANPKVVKYIDIPLQHISGPVLLAMNRPHRDHTEGLLRRLRERIPGLVLRSTFICGFPGEREEDHRALVRATRPLLPPSLSPARFAA